MSSEIYLLIGTAVTIALLHTAMGPDHYLPFIALSRSRKWSLSKTLWWTVVCGCGHVWSSVLLGLGGAAIGWSVSKIEGLEVLRGGVAGWSLFGFGLIYGAWGLVRARKGRHKHFDVYEEGSIFVFEHSPGEIVPPGERHRVTPWVMFLIFLLGPCEPMIPLLYLPALKNSTTGIIVLVTVYTLSTLVIMVLMVAAGFHGVSFLKMGKLERYMHALGGASIFICGAGMVFLQW